MVLQMLGVRCLGIHWEVGASDYISKSSSACVFNCTFTNIVLAVYCLTKLAICIRFLVSVGLGTGQALDIDKLVHW